ARTYRRSEGISGPSERSEGARTDCGRCSANARDRSPASCRCAWPIHGHGVEPASDSRETPEWASWLQTRKRVPFGTVDSAFTCSCPSGDKAISSHGRATGAGPPTTLPSVEKRDPWQGHAKPSPSLCATTHPRCVQTEEMA